MLWKCNNLIYSRRNFFQYFYDTTPFAIIKEELFALIYRCCFSFSSSIEYLASHSNGHPKKFNKHTNPSAHKGYLSISILVWRTKKFAVNWYGWSKSKKVDHISMNKTESRIKKSEANYFSWYRFLCFSCMTYRAIG